MSVLAVKSGGSYVELPDPAYQGYSTTGNELTKSDRNTLGNLIKERITVKVTISVEWHGLTATEKNRIISATGTNTFGVRYIDMDDDTVKTSTFYRGDTEISGYGRFNGSTFRYYDVKTTLIEVRRCMRHLQDTPRRWLPPTVPWTCICR